MLECVINISEGRDGTVTGPVAVAAGRCLLSVHTDAHHHRSVLTLGGPAEAVETAARRVAAEAVLRIDLGRHEGVHPRLGAVDVVPFVALDAGEDALGARDRFVAWAVAELAVPCFVYGPERTLPDIRRAAFKTLAPDAGPAAPHPTAGAMCVGVRPVLVAYNLWLAPPADVEVARRVAAAIRSPEVRSLGLDVGRRAQVSCNLIDPLAVGPAAVYDAVAAQASIERAELVGLVPAAVVDAADPTRWVQLDLDPSRTIETRLRGASAAG